MWDRHAVGFKQSADEARPPQEEEEREKNSLIKLKR